MISQTEIVIRVALGALIGGLIGFERQAHGRPAGFRTHILVCIASVLLMLVSEYYHYLSAFNPAYVRADPGRIAAGAITGIGFLGAGVILKTGATIQGLTTAASIWVVSAIGLAIGSGLYVASIFTSLITVVTLFLLRATERAMPRLSYRTLTLAAHETADEGAIISAITESGAQVSNIDYERCSGSKEVVYTVTVAFYKKSSVKGLFDRLSTLDFVRRICIKS